MSASPAIIVLGPSAFETAARIRNVMGGHIHGRPARVSKADVFFEDTSRHMQDLFRHGVPIIGVCAAGILIRALAPLLSDKGSEPPVIAVAEDGSAVVPLLGGHAGANDLARKIAGALDVSAAITTAGDVRFGVALDDPPQGWILANPEHAKDVMASLLAGSQARISGNIPWLDASGIPLADSGEKELCGTFRTDTGSPVKLIYHPKALVLGVGCERDCTAGELTELVRSTLAAHGLAPTSLALVASIDLKADEEAVHAVGEHFGVPVRFLSVDELNREASRLKNPSDIVLQEVGCPGVAEGAALASAGADGTLLVEKTKSKRATCAIAVAPEPIDPLSVGRSRGTLSVVGVGPGSADWRTAEAVSLLADATDWVGYGLYLDLVSDLRGNVREHRFDLGEEEKRARHALELAGEGRDVALVCSGDAGIYAMASLVHELLDCNGTVAPVSDAARRTKIIVAPGISALQAAAARVGAPIGHDFCAISLSDLLTPWETIERRLVAAATGDFVVALYNPRSLRRRNQFDQALDILHHHRAPTTPVVVASSLGRKDERVSVTTLGEIDPQSVDMMSVVLVGATQTRRTGMSGKPRVYTPRGYASKEPRP
ncbi:MAG: precorrin-3B C(17)-methyltransferase [Hyphomicrobiaceae bacterium]|nr:precorrin-3B C(17)-methyltransferase [Hyphomicrobiaceae bacterium]